jgi:hypothetical protein
MVPDGPAFFREQRTGRFIQVQRFRCPKCPKASTTIAVPGGRLRVDTTKKNGA